MSNTVRHWGAGLVLALALGTPAVGALAAPDIRLEAPTAAAESADSSLSGVWDQIRRGKDGELANAGGGVATLMKKPMIGPTEKAVGFTTPVHASFPIVGEPQGQGPTTAAIALLAAVFGGAFGVAAMLARNLGRH